MRHENYFYFYSPGIVLCPKPAQPGYRFFVGQTPTSIPFFAKKILDE